MTLKSITKKDDDKNKLLDFDPNLFGPSESLTNVINNFGKIIVSAYVILSKDP